MARLDDISRAREAIAVRAGQRWLSRGADRSEALVKAAKNGPASADTPERVAAFRAMMEKRGPARPPMLQERIIGPTLDFADRPPDDKARRAGLPVCRVVELRGKGVQPEGFGTGFLVAPNLMLTNHHVLPSKRDAVGVGANFGYERGIGGVMEGEIFELDPDAFFLNYEPLDFALVAVKSASLTGEKLEKLGFHKLISTTGKILVGQPINIIQYPEGGPKRYAVTENKLLDVVETYLHYQTDTLPGSSGSPTFNDFWETVALHHSGVPDMRDGRILDRRGQIWDGRSDDDINWVANEGVRISSLMNYLGGLTLQDPRQHALLRSVIDAPASPIVATAEAQPIAGGAAIAIASGPSMTNASANAIITITGPTTIMIGAAPAFAAPAPTAKESVGLEKKITFDPNYGNRRGYDVDFLAGHHVPLPDVAPERAREMLNDRRGAALILDYHHYSLVLNQRRRLQMWSAANVDYSPEVKPGIGRKELGTDDWRPDPRIPESLQLADEEFYGPARKFDRGHIVRREDGAWGATMEEIRFSNADTFHWTNCTPQHEGFNRSNLNGLWGNLENHITEQAGAVGDKYLIFAGPVLDNDHDLVHDWGGGEVQIPLEFWKVIAVAEEDGGRTGALRAYGFVLEQSSTIKKRGLEAFNVGEFAPYQRSLAEISALTGVVFDAVLTAADVMADAPQESRDRRRIAKPGDIRHRAGGGRPNDPRRPRRART